MENKSLIVEVAELVFDANIAQFYLGEIHNTYSAAETCRNALTSLEQIRFELARLEQQFQTMLKRAEE